MRRPLKALLMCVVIALALWATLLTERDQQACNARGGVYVRGAVGYQCVTPSTGGAFLVSPTP